MRKKFSPVGGIKLRAEQAVGAVVLYVLYGGISVLYREDTRVKEEIDGWKDGMIYYMECSPNGPTLMFGKRKGRLYRLTPDPQAADTCILFSHMDEAFRVLTGMAGIAGSYAAHGFALKGDIVTAMTFSRVVDLVESYLFPYGMTKRILKEVAGKELGSLEVYGKIVLGALFGNYRRYSVKDFDAKRAMQSQSRGACVQKAEHARKSKATDRMADRVADRATDREEAQADGAAC